MTLRERIFLIVTTLLVVVATAFVVSISHIVRDLARIDKKLAIEIAANRTLVAEETEFMSVVRVMTENSKNMTAEEIVAVSNEIAMQCYLHSDIGLTRSLVGAIIEQESNFDPTVISKDRAYGLMQCLRSVFEMHLPALGYATFTVELALNPVVNVQVGIRELVRLRKYWLSEGVDSWMTVLSSYFWGIRYTWNNFINNASQYGSAVLEKAEEWLKEVG